MQGFRPKCCFGEVQFWHLRMPTPIPGWRHSRMPDPISGCPTHLKMPTPISGCPTILGCVLRSRMSSQS